MASNPESVDMSSFWWHVNIPQLSEGGAREIIRMIVINRPDLFDPEEDPSDDLIDPRDWFACFIDRDTAKVIREGLRLLEPERIAEAMGEAIDEWLEFNVQTGGMGSDDVRESNR